VARLTNNTVSGNTAKVGGGINGNLLADLTLTHGTVTDNPATSGGIFQAGTSRLTGTIVADQAAGSDCAGAGTVDSDDDNLNSDGTCDLIDANDLPAIMLRIFGAGFAEDASCHANSDAVVDAGDLSCAARVIFLGRGACASP